MDEDLIKTIERQRRLGYGWRWDGLGGWTTEAIFAKLREWGVDISPETFRAHAQAAGRPSHQENEWAERMQAFADEHTLDIRFWLDFPLFAATELWKRLTPDLPCPELVADRLCDAFEETKSRNLPEPQQQASQLQSTLGLLEYLKCFPEGERGERLDEIVQLIMLDFGICLTDLIFQQAKEAPEEITRIAEFFGGIRIDWGLEKDLALGLAWAGRREESHNQVKRNLERHPDDAKTLYNAAEVYKELKEYLIALEFYRAARKIETNPHILQIIDKSIDEITRDLRFAGSYGLPSASPMPQLDTVQRRVDEFRPEKPQGRVMPNQRCPCGSGKKFKKCCGRFG